MLYNKQCTGIFPIFAGICLCLLFDSNLQKEYTVSMSELIYTSEVEEMCCVKQGPNHGPAPIPEEGKWVKA